jgi:hypothetical protein
MVRDSWFVEAVEIQSPKDVVTLVNRLNAEGVTVFRRLSPPVLIAAMEMACEQSARFHESLDPFAPAAFGVSWAGEATSLNWFDTARELTERWHHQQQIRLATNHPGTMTPELYHPVLDCFLRGLPHLYRDVDAPTGTALPGDIRRMRRAVVSVETKCKVATGGTSTGGVRRPSDDTPGNCLARIYERGRPRIRQSPDSN